MDELRERTRAMPTPPRDLDRVTKRAGAIRRRRILTGSLVAVVAISGVVVPFALLSPLDRGPAVLGPTSSDRVVRDDGLALTIPAGWTVNRQPSGESRDGWLLAVGNYSTPSARDCQANVPDDALAVVIADPRGTPPDALSTYPPRRPGSFSLRRPYPARTEVSCDSGERVPGAGYRFSDGGRYLEAWVIWAPGTPASMREQAYRVLDSLRVEDPVDPGTCVYWSHPACHDAQWLLIVIDDARGGVMSDTQAAFVVRARGPADLFYLWAFPKPTDPEIGPADDRMEVIGMFEGVEIRSDGNRGYWETDEMIVWFESGPRQTDRLPSIETLTPFVRASLDVPYPPVLFGED